MGLDISKVKNYKAPLPAKGKVILEIVDLKMFESKNANEVGEKTQGLDYRLKIVGPDEAIMDNGDSAIGYTFFDRMMLPTQTTEAKSPQWSSKQKARFSKRLDAIYGKGGAPDDLDNSVLKERVGVQFQAAISTGWDDFADDYIVKIGDCKAIGEES